MSNETKILGGILVASLLLLVGGFFLSSRGTNNPPTTSNQTVNINYSLGQKIGSDSAKIKLVEFSDLQCPACKAAEPYVEQARKMDNVQLIYRHFPLPQHRFSWQVATVAEEAGKVGKFWPMHDKLFETQDRWSALSDPTSFFLDLSKQLGVDPDKVKQALDKKSDDSVIQADVNEGNSLGVNSTPTFFLNGKKLNLRNYGDLVSAVSSP